MPTYYRTPYPIQPAHYQALEEHHQMMYPGNKPGVVTNIAQTECLVLCCDAFSPPPGMQVLGVYDTNNAKTLLSSPGWIHPAPPKG